MSLRHIDISSLHPLILRLLLAVGLIVAATACTDEADAPDRPTPADPKVGTISLYLGMGDTFAPASRAASTSRTPEGTYNPGAGFENYIDISRGDFRLYAFDGNTNAGSTESENSILYCEIPNADITIVPVDFGPDNRHYILSFPITQSFKDHFEAVGLKLVLLANWHGSYPTVAPRTDDPAGTETHADPAVAYDLTPGTATLQDLVSNSKAIMGYNSPTAYEILGDNFAAPLTPAVDRDNLIPLFGVRNYGTLPALEPGNSHWLSTLNLLRALAKVEVYDAPDSPVHIHAARITRYNTRLYKAPLGINEEADYVTGKYDTDYGNAPSIPSPEGSNYESDDALPMQTVEVKNADNSVSKHFVIYVPEYQNLTAAGVRTDTERMRIELEYGDKPTGTDAAKDTKKYYIDFATYTTDGNGPSTKGDHFNVCRNYWYKFEVTKDREVKVQVIPYAEVDLRPGFGLITDNAHYIPITVEEKDSSGNVTLKTIYYDPKTGIYYDEDKVTPIANPYPGLDPVTGRYILSDSHFNTLYYFDNKDGEYQYYGPDNSTKIKNPYDKTCYNSTTGITTVITLEGDHLFYYYKSTTCQFFAPTPTFDSSKEILPEVMVNKDGLAIAAKMKFTIIANDQVCYYDIIAEKYYSDEAMTTEIANPFI